ncbi:hypothetical protein FRC03_007434 [Tulasnella sp. 419]|nr:hypothetical protein FRC03_007434 [Tulasnella sp. 419]
MMIQENHPSTSANAEAVEAVGGSDSPTMLEDPATHVNSVQHNHSPDLSTISQEDNDRATTTTMENSTPTVDPSTPGPTSSSIKEEGVFVEKLQAELTKSRSEISRLKQELHDERQKRKKRDEEVASLRQYKAAHDTSQGSDASTLIANINDSASTLADDLSMNWDLSKEKLPLPNGTEHPTRGLDLALARCPMDRSHAQPLLQFGFRACIMRRVSIIMHQPCYGMDESFGRVIQQLEGSVARTNASQPTFARWRAIAYDALISEQFPSQRLMIPKLCHKVVSDLERTGMLVTGRQLEKDDRERLAHDTDLEERLEDIISKAFLFIRMVNIDIVSANYKHSYFIYGSKFNGKEMGVPESADEPEDGDKVATTVGLGLLKHERMIGVGIGRLEDKWSVQIKAEVLTEREISEIIRDMPAPVYAASSQGLSAYQVPGQWLHGKWSKILDRK